jgi:hypothetical protein
MLITFKHYKGIAGTFSIILAIWMGLLFAVDATNMNRMNALLVGFRGLLMKVIHTTSFSSYITNGPNKPERFIILS